MVVYHHYSLTMFVLCLRVCWAFDAPPPLCVPRLDALWCAAPRLSCLEPDAGEGAFFQYFIISSLLRVRSAFQHTWSITWTHNCRKPMSTTFSLCIPFSSHFFLFFRFHFQCVTGWSLSYGGSNYTRAILQYLLTVVVLAEFFSLLRPQNVFNQPVFHRLDCILQEITSKTDNSKQNLVNHSIISIKSIP